MDFSNAFRRFLMLIKNINHIASSVHKSLYVCSRLVWYVCFWFVAFHPGQQYFSHVGMLSYLPGLNKY